MDSGGDSIHTKNQATSEASIDGFRGIEDGNFYVSAVALIEVTALTLTIRMLLHNHVDELARNDDDFDDIFA
jgi:hypothetical protein